MLLPALQCSIKVPTVVWQYMIPTTLTYWVITAHTLTVHHPSFTYWLSQTGSISLLRLYAFSLNEGWRWVIFKCTQHPLNRKLDGPYSESVAHAGNKTQDQAACNLVTKPTELSQVHSHIYFLTYKTVLLCGVQHKFNLVQVRYEHSNGQIRMYTQGHPCKIQTPVQWNRTAPPPIITQKYYSTTFILLHLLFHKKKLCVHSF
jgi:hypothetical protein